MNTGSAGGIRPWEWSLSLAVLAMLVLRAVALTVSPRLEPPWCDELFTYYQVDHATFKELRLSLGSNINASPPQYYILLWMVGRIFTPSIMTLRMVSAICAGSAFAVAWSVLRRHLAFFPASLAACIVFLGSDLFLYAGFEARFYGPYLLGGALMLYGYDALSRTARPGFGLLALNVLCQSIAVSTSYVAGLYSAMILLALVIGDRLHDRWRPWAYGSFVAGWFPVVFCLNNIAGSGVGWIKKPDIYYLFHPFNPQIEIGNIYYALLLLAVAALIYAWNRTAAGDHQQETGLEDIALVAAVFLSVPYVCLLISWLGKPMMLDRYYCPSLIGLAISAGIGVQRALGPLELSSQASLKSRCVLHALKAVILAALILHPLLETLHLKRNQPREESAPAWAGSSQIVVADNFPTYLPLVFDEGSPANLFLVVRQDREGQKNQASVAKFHRNLQTIDIETLIRNHPTITLAEDTGYPEFLWVKSLLLARGYHPLANEVQNHTRSWTVLSRNPR